MQHPNYAGKLNGRDVYVGDTIEIYGISAKNGDLTTVARRVKILKPEYCHDGTGDMGFRVADDDGNQRTIHSHIVGQVVESPTGDEVAAWLKPACERCKWWKRKRDGGDQYRGTCHLNPPAFRGGERWPETADDEYCGRFDPLPFGTRID